MKYTDYKHELEEIIIDFQHATINVNKHNLDLAKQYARQGLSALEKLSEQEIEDEEDTTP